MSMTDDFIEDYGQDFLERMFEAIYSHGQKTEFDGFFFFEHDYSDAINSTGYLSFTDKDGDEIMVSFSDGNISGSVVENYGPDASHERPPIVLRRFVIDRSEANWVRKTLRLEQWKADNTNRINDMEIGMNYDYKFSPCSKTYQYYRDYADKHGFTIETYEVKRQS